MIPNEYQRFEKQMNIMVIIMMSMMVIFMIAVLILSISVIHAEAMFLDGTNTTDVDWGLVMQEKNCPVNPCQLIDDDLEEEEEIEDEKIHEEES